jgi:hypothetical protein
MYNDPARSAMSFFDTGSAVISFSAADQARFTAAGNPIPIKVYGGAFAQGIGGRVTGDVSQPGTIIVGGLGQSTAAPIDGGPRGSGGGGGTGGTGGSGIHSLIINRVEIEDQNSWYGTGVQAFIGTHQGSPHMPTITGTPILYVDPDHPNGMAALIILHGSTLDFSGDIPGLTLSMADLQFVPPGSSLLPSDGTSPALRIPLSLRGIDNHRNPGNQVTETPTPVQSAVALREGSANVSGQTFLFDTGAQVTLISTATARALGLDLNHPDYFGSVTGVGGSLDVPGYTLDELDLPLADGGLLQFTHASVYVADVNGADGVLGMNLFNTASQMLYDPFGTGGASVSVTFATGTRPSDGSTASGLATLAQTDPFLASAIHGMQVPELSVFSARIAGHVFLDYNQDGTMSSREPGLPGQTVFLDANNNGLLDDGEISMQTDPSGLYQFNNLIPGSYTVREIVPSGLASVSATRSVATVPASNGVTTSVDFGMLPIQQDALTAYIANLYGTVLDRAPDVAGYTGWLRYLQGGGSRQQVSNAVWESPEHRGLQVDSFYQNLLHRAADPAGRAGFVSAMLGGATEYDVEQLIIGSPEYRSLHPDDASFLSAVYQDVLGRAVDSTGQTAWLVAMQRGMSRAQVAGYVLGSLEHELLAVGSYFRLFLHRDAQTADNQIWALYIRQTNPTPDQLVEPIIGSDEFFAVSRQLASS